jgi:flavin-dependent thymidylate synthase
MKIILAGYNLDSSVIAELKKNSPPREDVTPETLSASYARISRDPRSVDKLREVARAEVEKARRSNRNIIFKMGHHSVAEHAVFNFDVIGVSRLAVEEIEHFRLCSYTEKSQRYIKLGDDYLVPEEVKQAGKKEIYLDAVHRQNRMYHKLYNKLKPYFWRKYSGLAENPKNHALLDGWAKEDARYVLSLATLGQLGMTLNARNLEHMIRRFAAHPLAEIQELNRSIHDLAKEVAPSIILFTEANDFDVRTYAEIKGFAADIDFSDRQPAFRAVRLVDFTPDADDKLAAALMHSVTQQPYPYCRDRAASLTVEEKRSLFKTAFRHMEFYDTVLREFEYVGLTFELETSATCFAQLKRHRMSTLTTQAYDPALGIVVPPSITAVAAEAEFKDVIRASEKAFAELKASLEHGAEYILTNAHCKRVLWKVSAREFYHFSRLREDATAQWDIRRIAGEMTVLAEKAMPLTMMLIGGKDAYAENYLKTYGIKPKMSPAEE